MIYPGALFWPGPASRGRNGDHWRDGYFLAQNVYATMNVNKGGLATLEAPQPVTPEGLVPMPPQSTCSVVGCENSGRSRGWCDHHYYRWKKYGDPLGTRKPPPTTLERFWSKVDKNGPIPTARPDLGKCWIWLAQRDKLGYGYFWHDGRSRPAYRFSYVQARGTVPEGLELDHLCREPSCIRPDHLEAVTHAENLRRGDAGWNLVAAARSKTHCPNGHTYDQANTKIDKRGHRYCIACKREHGRKHDQVRESGWARSKARAEKVTDAR